MVYALSILKTGYKIFEPVDVCPDQGNNEQGVACTIDLICLMRFVCSSSIQKQ